MSLEEFIPPDSEILSKEVFSGIICHVDTFSANILLYDAPDKIMTFSKCMFVCPEEDIVLSYEVKIHYWKEKDGTQGTVVEIMKKDK